MNSDYTQQQSLTGLEKAEQLSLNSAVPPAEVKGYRIEKLLGQGAFGQVWLAHDLNTRRPVAIKFYLHRGNINWSLINREVSHLVSMSTGRHIVQVLGVGWEAEPPYYVMEYLENGSLEDMIRAQGSLSIPLATKMLREIAEGLSYAHSKGVLHCDLKPANVMLDHDWQPRLADFGQSRMSNDQTASLGTLFFMAPEQADLEAQPDAAWDVYALGAIAYSMLVGSPPYRTPEVVETLDTADTLPDRLARYRNTIRHAKKPRLHYKRRAIDKGLCQIIDRCLATNPEKRYTNVQQVIGAIDSRNRARTRRPLFLMGIVGPLLFLMLMLFFSTRSISVAKNESIQSVQQWSLRSNKFASQLAAQSLESELATLFRLVEDEAQRETLRERVQAVSMAAPSLIGKIADGKDHPEERETLRSLPEQKALNAYLQTRMANILSEGISSAAIFNSVFVNDARGTNLGINFADPLEQLTQSPVGRNFAYRSYFNGQRADSVIETPSSEFSPTRMTHLSSSFRSTATRKYKVGISAPIWPASSEDEVDRTQQEPIGVLVLTINLGDFELLASDNQAQPASNEPEEQAASVETERFASLVDGREGNQQGRLLQHPYLKKLESLSGSTKLVWPRIDPRFLEKLIESDGIVDYRDPAAESENGREFEGEWIAAIQQVSLPRMRGVDSNQRGKSDLWVLVQERASTVAEPVTALGARLQRETYIELAVLVIVMLTLWFLVFRIGQSFLKGGGVSGVTDSTSSSLSSTLESGN